MKQKVLEKMAAQDAHEYGVAQMFFGPGAGTKRKLLDATIGDKIRDIPGYEMAFEQAASRLNQTEMAEQAIALRKKIDGAHRTSKNLRAIRQGNLKNLDDKLGFIVFAGLGTYTVLRATGYDKVVAEEAKKGYKKARTEARYRWARYQGRNVTKII